MKIALGAANFGQKYGINNKKIKVSEIKYIKNYLSSTKIKIFDTSEQYKNSEKIIGKLNIKNPKVITKIKFNSEKSKNFNVIENKISNSITNLNNIQQIYGVLIHDYKDLLRRNGKKVLYYLENLKKKKIIKYIGISIYSPKELDIIWKFWKPDIVQAPLNILDQRIVDSGWLRILKENKILFYPRSIFLQGLLIKKNENIILNKNIKKNINKFYDWCNNSKITPLEACVQFIKQFNNVNYVIVGFDNLNQLKTIVKLFKKKKIFVPKKFKTKNLNLIDPRKWKIKKK